MKTHYILFAIVYALLLTACTPTHRDSEWLKQAEEHFDAGRTDSILTYLYKINENRLSEEEQRTFFRMKFTTFIQTDPEGYKQM